MNPPIRSDVAASWLATNPVLALNEAGADEYGVKVGNGVMQWAGLPYAGITRDEAARLYPNPTGALDSQLAELVNLPASQARGALGAAFDVRRRFGRAILLGDSLDQGTVGSGGGSGGWINYLSVLSNGKVRLAANAGIGGNTTTLMLGRLQTDVLALNPDICIIGGPTNDHSQGIPEATTRANYASIVAQLRAAGITPVFRNCPPNDSAGAVAPWNTVALRRKAIQRHNAWLSGWAATQGIDVLDLYGPLVDETTGGYLSAYAGDGTHPTAPGYKLAAQAMVTAGLPSCFSAPPALPVVVGQDGFITWDLSGDGLFLGTPQGNGATPGVTLVGTDATTNVVTDATIPGNWQHVASASAGSATVDLRMSTGFTLGHRYAVMCRVQVATGGFRLRGAVWSGSGTSDLQMSETVTGIAYVEIVPTGAATSLRAVMGSFAAGASDFQVAQVGIKDLTALGLA